MDVQKAVHAEFRRRGLALRRESVRLVADYVRENALPVEDVALLVLDALDKRQMSSSIVDVKAVEEVIEALLEGRDDEDEPIEIISSFDMPKYSYDPIKRAFWCVPTKPSVFADAKSKIALYQERLMVLQNRAQRNKFFSRPALELSSSTTREYCELTTVQGLMNSAGVTKFLLGVLTEIEDGALFLEDTTGSVRCDMSNSVPTVGLFTENCIIIAEGFLRADRVFEVVCLGFPHLESRIDFRTATGGANFFGGRTIQTATIPALEARETAAHADMFIVLSDVWLDRPDSLANLQRLLEGFNSVEIVPTMFVFMGNFLSQPINTTHGNYEQYKAGFSALADLLCQYERLLDNSQFVFVPGPGDPAPSPALPRPPLANCLTSALREKVPNAVFSSNPCRLRFLSQEIVLFREDLQSRMMRLTRIPPQMEETQSLFEHLAMTVLQQGHLCPLPLNVQPIYWDFDHALRLYSSPHALVLADFTSQQDFRLGQEADCNCFNPGSFGNEGVFAAYRPASRTVELCSV